MKFSPIEFFRRFLKFINLKSKDKALSSKKEKSSSNIQNSSPYKTAGQKGIGFFFCLAAGRSPIILPKTLFFVLLCFLALPSMTFC